MREPSISMTRRLVIAMLALEIISALILVFVVGWHEYRVQTQAFDDGLIAGTQTLMGAVQDAEDVDDNVMLDQQEVHLRSNALYRVKDELGRTLGTSVHTDGLPDAEFAPDGFHELRIGHTWYRVLVFHGRRIIDPGEPGGGRTHHISIVYGQPMGKVWHEVFEAVRFFAIATLLSLGLTAALMVLLVRRYLKPVHQLAVEADHINHRNWAFRAPASAWKTTELAPLARALEAALTRVQLSFDQQRRFTHDAAHELKTDVAIVKSSLQLVSMRDRTAAEYREGLAVSIEDCTRLESTVEKLLTLARLEQPPTEREAAAASANCSLQKAAEEAAYQSSALAQLKTIAVETAFTWDAQVPLDRRDAVLLCSNLLVNALQHSPAGSRIQLAIAQRGNEAVFTCKDWGEGIAEQDLPFLFDPFYRGDASRSRKSGGTGLGLSICKAICSRAGGSIEISNHAEKGALVTVLLPVSQSAPTD